MARQAARFDVNGGIIVLEEQDRNLWDRAAIDGALASLNPALRSGKPGFFLCQAAIAGCHATAKSERKTDWLLVACDAHSS